MSDYVTDAKGVIDQSVRILQAMIDVAAGGWLATALGAMNLMQMVMQGRAARDRARHLPRVDFDHAEKLAGRGVETLPHRAPRADGPGTREGRLTRGGGARRRDGRDRRARRGLPLVDVAATRVSLGGGPSGEDACVEVSLRRFKPRQERRRRPRAAVRRREVGAPRGVSSVSETQGGGWWLVLRDRTSRELLALRRVSFGDRRRRSSRTSPRRRARQKIWWYTSLSDCYLGMDQEVEISAAGRVEFHGAHGEGEKGEGRGKRNGGTLAGRREAPAPRGGKGSVVGRRPVLVARLSTSRTETDFGWTRAGVAAATRRRESNPTPNEAATDDDDDDFWEAPDGRSVLLGGAKASTSNAPRR